MYACVSHAYLVARGGHQSLRKRSYRQLGASMYVLRIKPRSFGRTASAFNH